MSLIGLENIEWDKLTHAYGNAEKIPEFLRTLDESQTKEEFDQWLKHIINLVNHQDDIYDSTAPTVRFLIQILQKSIDPSSKLSLLLKFGTLLRDIQHYPFGYFSNPVECSVVLLRNNIATYDAILEGLEEYLSGTVDENEAIRLASLYILFALVEQREEILPRLVACVDLVNEEWFQACVVWTFANIAVYDKYGRGRYDYHRQLNMWLEHKNALVRYAAAFGKLRVYMASPKNSELAITIIAEALKANVWASKGDVWGDKLDIYLELTPFNNPIQWITRSSRLPDMWIAILQQLNPTPLQAHICITEMLKLAFTVKNVGDSLPKWTSFDLGDTSRTSIVYYEAVSPERFSKDRPVNKRQSNVLQTIVDCEPFWEIPTNLFSFFYGLPDDREELRKLLS